MLVPVSNEIGSTIGEVRLWPDVDTLVQNYKVPPLEGLMAGMADAVSGVAWTDEESESVKLYRRYGVTPTLIPPMTAFDVVQKCDGELCECGAIVVRFLDGPFAGQEAVLAPGEYITRENVAAQLTDAEAAAFLAVVADPEFDPDLQKLDDSVVYNWQDDPNNDDDEWGPRL